MKQKILLPFLILYYTFTGVTATYGQSREITLTLDDAIALAADSSLTAFRYKNMYRSSYWAYRSYRANRLPSLTLDLIPAQYYRNMTQRYDSENDMDLFREQQMFSASGGLSLRQNVDFLGGTLYANTELDYLYNFGDTRYSQFSAIPFQIGYSQNLLGYNAYRWERKIEPLKYERARQELIYNIESLSGTVVDYFFSLALAQANYDLAIRNAAATDTLCRVGERKHAIAAISQADLLTLRLDAVNARNSLQNARIELQRAMHTLTTYLGLDKETIVKLTLPTIPKLRSIDVDEALAYAKANNPSLLAHEQSILEAQQSVDRTSKELYFNASVNASIGFNQAGERIADAYHRPLAQNVVSVGVSVPLVDWGVRKGKLNMARGNLNVVEIAAKQEEMSIEQEVTMAVGDSYVQHGLIESANQAVQLAELAYTQTHRRFLIGEADVNALILAQNRKQTAEQNYIGALRSFWQTYYKLRRLTLHDFVQGRAITYDMEP